MGLGLLECRGLGFGGCYRVRMFFECVCVCVFRFVDFFSRRSSHTSRGNVKLAGNCWVVLDVLSVVQESQHDALQLLLW